MKFICGWLIGLVVGFGICYANIDTIIKENAKNSITNIGEDLRFVEEKTSVWDAINGIVNNVSSICD